ncbi:GNAT family N-acetyltransferase [Marinibaculum pumilum]|uniref:GNAT family N-acetyltransferase n=1 Tax=Marinibaculum pumilum TaxID=1766165 RepID=A0ABV7L105_9PROT
MRRFNRFHTQRIGVLDEGLLQSGFTLAEARVLFELAHHDGLTASQLCRDLGLDQGYLSRILTRFQKRGLLARRTAEADRRQALLSLTASGWDAFAPLDRASQDQAALLLRGLSAADRADLCRAMARIEALLAPATPDTVPPDAGVILRPHRVGDIGWIVQRQALLYSTEFGWDGSFEALVAEIGAAFLRNFDPAAEGCWVAEREGEPLGAVFLVRAAADTGQLRMLYVERAARGLGIGGRLVDACIARAREAGYDRLTLWTNDILVSARKIYLAAGFRLVREEPHHSFGQDLVGQYWELDLSDKPTAGG